jgi:phosphate transport system protein
MPVALRDPRRRRGGEVILATPPRGGSARSRCDQTFRETREAMADPAPVNDPPAALASLRADIERQGQRVMEIFLRAVEAYFDGGAESADAIVADDDLIDRVDVEIERACIAALAAGLRSEHEIRTVVTIVKINNELERIADCAVNIAEAVRTRGADDPGTPPTFRVMANSVIGMLRDSNRALASGHVELATEVLRFDDTVDRFKSEILRDAQRQVSAGSLPVAFAFRLLAVTKAVERIADHCTNICEQVIYLQTGKIVRHLQDGWSEPALPKA